MPLAPADHPAMPTEGCSRRATGVWPAVDAATAAVFRTLSGLRGKRIMHPSGEGYGATFQLARGGLDLMPSDAAAFPETTFDVLLRFSRAVGLPEVLPDVYGLAMRILDFHGSGRSQDLLLVTSGQGPVLRRALLPARRPLAHNYSSVLPYRIHGRSCLLGARPVGAGDGGPGKSGLELEVLQAASSSPWRVVGRLTIGKRLSEQEAEALRFDPWNTGDSIRPAGLLNRLRLPAYSSSQQGRLGRLTAETTVAPCADRERSPAAVPGRSRPA